MLATPQLIEAKAEGTVSVNGLTQIEVGSGVVVREKITPTKHNNQNNYHINIKGNAGVPDSPLKNRVQKILNVYRGNKQDKVWNIVTDYLGYGLQRAYIDGSNFDPTAEYYVTYLVYDRNQFTTNVLTATATFAANIRTSLDDTVKKLEDVKTESSINTLILYDILKRIKAGGL